MYPIEKYKFYTNGSRVIAVSTYAGKTVRGVAVCHAGDAFSLEKGKKLAVRGEDCQEACCPCQSKG